MKLVSLGRRLRLRNKSDMLLQRAHSLRIGNRTLVPLTAGAESVAEATVARESSLVLVLSGSATIAGDSLGRGTAALLPEHGPIEVADGSAVAAISGFGPVARPHFARRQVLGHFERYLARVARLTFDASAGEAADSWSLYDVQVDARGDWCELHVHERVKNLVLLQGPADAPTATLVVAVGACLAAWNLHGGHSVFVPPGVEHAVVRYASPDTRMFVFNDSEADYEDTSKADFHVTRRVSWNDMVAGRTRGSGSMHTLIRDDSGA
jgi:hypothetical protein